MVNAAAPATLDLRGWSVEYRRADDGLAGLRAEWDDLVGRCSAATPFQWHAWLDSWWRCYGLPGRLRLVLVRRDGRLVAAAPLMLRWRAACPVLTPLGGAVSDFTDVLVDDGMAAEASGVLAEALVRQPGWQVVDFPEARPDAVAGTALWDAWRGDRLQTPASVCLELTAMPMEDLVRSLPARARKSVRHRLNQLGRAGLEVREVNADDAGRAVADLLRLHERQWHGRAINMHHMSRPFAEHLARSMRNMIGSRQGAVLEYRLAGSLVASSVLLTGRNLVGGYLYGADPALRERVDLTTMMLVDMLPVARALGCSTVSMLRGVEPYKYRWGPRESQNRRLVLTRPGSVLGVLYETGVRTAPAALLAAKEHAPWLRAVRDQARRSVAAVHAGRPR